MGTLTDVSCFKKGSSWQSCILDQTLFFSRHTLTTERNLPQQILPPSFSFLLPVKHFVLFGKRYRNKVCLLFVCFPPLLWLKCVCTVWFRCELVGLCSCSTQVLPLCPERPPGAEVCRTSGTVSWSLLLAEDRVSPEHTAPSWSPDAPSSCNNNNNNTDATKECSCRIRSGLFQLHSSLSVQEAANARVISLSFIIHLFILSGVELQQTHFYLLWIFSSTFSAQKAFTSKSTPQAWRHTKARK